MRVTSNTYTNLVIDSSQDAQQRLATLQDQISSGNTISAPSDDPLAYEQATQQQNNIAQLNAFSSAANTATTLTTANNSAMTSLHQIVANASELATSVTGNMSASEMANVGTQVGSLISELTSIVNQQSGGHYLFGGTADQPPIDSTGNYNTATNGQTSTIEVGQGNNVQSSIVAGQAGTPGVDGFLYDSTSGVDVLGALKQLQTDLNSGNAMAVQGTDQTAVSNALDHISMYVGSTAANMSAVATASQTTTTQITSATNQLNALTQTNLPTASLQLQQIQNQYEATLEAGTKIMGMSILNFLGGTSS
jgi:flagellar hook-associated protein 3 FlgL